jgi:hypothetical protein
LAKCDYTSRHIKIRFDEDKCVFPQLSRRVAPSRGDCKMQVIITEFGDTRVTDIRFIYNVIISYSLPFRICAVFVISIGPEDGVGKGSHR